MFEGPFSRDAGHLVTTAGVYSQFEDGSFGPTHHGDEVPVADGSLLGLVHLLDHLAHLHVRLRLAKLLQHPRQPEHVCNQI